MLSENIRHYRKKNNLSQDELAEKLGVSRQSVSFWETAQTQPTIDNIIALAKVFNVSTDILLGNCDNINISQEKVQEEVLEEQKMKKSKARAIVAICVAAVVMIAVAIAVAIGIASCRNQAPSSSGGTVASTEEITEKESSALENTPAGTVASTEEMTEKETLASENTPFDLYSYCKNFAIEKGQLNGDYCIYQQPSTKYGGYENEYFSISYWADSDMVEFCLHCPLDETYSHNFYLRMRGGYDGEYEYASAKYFRDTGESLRFANGSIDPAVFYDGYPISCDIYEGNSEGQTKFMEDSRIGICDLIRCLKEFVEVEDMDCDFSDFDFIHF